MMDTGAHDGTIEATGRRTVPETNPTLSLNSSSDCLKWPLKFEVAHGQMAKNRIMKAPMSEMVFTSVLLVPFLALAAYNSENDTISGLPTESLLRLYRLWSVGGAGIIVTGSVAINEASCNPFCVLSLLESCR
ncbi:hypothetical protein AB6A40_005886 [Gnathostoma spinigerum]|uniref:Uncharacterized protein n=1 Tax=Gnathostoma spinigerum TaxID=75299 RepID=A0ABD6ERJ6_9BILA